MGDSWIATYHVEAIGSTDAVDIASRRARDDGLRVRKVSAIDAVDERSRTERTRWVVRLVVRQ